MYVVVFVVFLNLGRLIFSCVGNLFFSYPLNSLNRVRICASTPYSAPRDLQKQDRVIARFSCYSNFAKSLTKIGKLAYGAVLTADFSNSGCSGVSQY